MPNEVVAFPTHNKFSTTTSGVNKLDKGDYSEEKKRVRRKASPLVGAYWCLVTAIYLGVNFYHTSLGDKHCWKITWPIWPVAALVFVVLLGIFHAVAQSRDRS